MADALDIIMAGEAKQGIKQHADRRHADSVAQIAVANALIEALDCREATDEGGAGSCGDQSDALPGRHGHDLAESGAERGADLDDRALAADRRAGADRYSRGQRLDGGDDRSDASFIVINGVHHFRHAMAARLGREGLDQESNDQATDHGGENDESAEAAFRRERIGVVSQSETAVEGDIVDEADEVAKDHRAESRPHADDDPE
jgi:hypothetical protein